MEQQAKPDKKIFKKCIKCRQWKRKLPILDENGVKLEKAGFGKHGSGDGYQSICQDCKNTANKQARTENVTARLRHHIGTRCVTQLGDYVPPKFLANLEDYLGYRIETLVRHLKQDLKAREGSDRRLRDALNEGYHVDHKYPLSRFPVIVDGEVDWVMFQKCWAIANLSAIPASENLAKGAKVLEEHTQHAN